MIINATRRRQLARGHIIRSGMLGRALGLMFSRRPRAMLFVFPLPRRYGIHMFFVFFPIDLLFLSSRRQVIGIKERLRPWQIYQPERAYSFLIELPAGTVARTGTEEGDTVGWR